MNPLYPAVALRAMHRCEYCHAPEAVFNLPFEVEHIIPIAHGARALGYPELEEMGCNCSDVHTDVVFGASEVSIVTPPDGSGRRWHLSRPLQGAEPTAGPVSRPL